MDAKLMFSMILPFTIAAIVGIALGFGAWIVVRKVWAKRNTVHLGKYVVSLF